MVARLVEGLLVLTTEGVGHLAHAGLSLIPVVGKPLAAVAGLVLPG